MKVMHILKTTINVETLRALIWQIYILLDIYKYIYICNKGTLNIAAQISC